MQDKLGGYGLARTRFTADNHALAAVSFREPSVHFLCQIVNVGGRSSFAASGGELVHLNVIFARDGEVFVGVYRDKHVAQVGVDEFAIEPVLERGGDGSVRGRGNQDEIVDALAFEDAQHDGKEGGETGVFRCCEKKKEQTLGVSSFSLAFPLVPRQRDWLGGGEEKRARASQYARTTGGISGLCVALVVLTQPQTARNRKITINFALPASECLLARGRL